MVRSIYLLDWFNDEELSADATGNVNTVVSYHAFSAQLITGNSRNNTTSNPSAQEKRVMNNELGSIAFAVTCRRSNAGIKRNAGRRAGGMLRLTELFQPLQDAKLEAFR